MNKILIVAEHDGQNLNAAIAKANTDLAAAAVRAGDECQNALGVAAVKLVSPEYVQLETLAKLQRKEVVAQRVMGSIHRIAVAAGYTHCTKHANGTKDASENCVDVTHIGSAKLAELIEIAEQTGHFDKTTTMREAPASMAWSAPDVMRTAGLNRPSLCCPPCSRLDAWWG
jgi:hypothetical protein